MKVIRVKERGPQGVIGPTGLQILTGTVDPTTEGRDGDWYINSVAMTIFGPKAAGVWPAGIPITAFSPATPQPYYKFDTAAAHAVAQGEVAWNADELTLDIGQNGSVLQVGLEMQYHVSNKTGADIVDGRPVMFTQSIGASGRGAVAYADLSIQHNAPLYLGIATETIADNGVGKITRFGRIRGINASGAGTNKLCFGTETWLDGDALYVDPDNPGYLTNVKPSVPKVVLSTAWVLDNHATTGTIFCHANNHDEIAAWGDRVTPDGYLTVASDSSIVFPKFSGKGIKVDVASPDWPWQDLIGEITIRGVKATDPDFNPYIGSYIREYQFSVGDYVHNDFHILHDQAPGTDMYIHAHWSHNSAAAPTGNVTFEFEIAYAKGHDQAPFVVKTVEVTQAASPTQYQHMIAEIPFTVAGGDATRHDNGLIETDGILLVATRLKASTLSGGVTPFVHLIDIHYQSTGIGTKNKAPNFHL